MPKLGGNYQDVSRNDDDVRGEKITLRHPSATPHEVVAFYLYGSGRDLFPILVGCGLELQMSPKTIVATYDVFFFIRSNAFVACMSYSQRRRVN